MHYLLVQGFFTVRTSTLTRMRWAHDETGLSVATPPQAPKIFSWTTSVGTPIPALLMTSSISALCFSSSFIGSGELWGWLQNIVGVSNQVCPPLKLWDECSLFTHFRSRGYLLDCLAGGFGRPGSSKDAHSRNSNIEHPGLGHGALLLS